MWFLFLILQLFCTVSVEQVTDSLDTIKIMDSKAKEDFLKSPIEKLNQKTLILIFKNLPIIDLVKIELVSKYWQETALLSWDKLKKLSIVPKKYRMDTDPNSPFIRYEYENINEIGKLLKRCGKFLEEIDTEYVKTDISSVIADYCENIKSICCHKVSIEGVEKLAKRCKNISKLTIIILEPDANKRLEEALGNLFSNNRKLQFLELDPNCDLSVDCLLKLSLDQMIIMKTGIRGQSLIDVYKNTKMLSSFYYRFKNLGGDVAVFKFLYTHLYTLTTLHLHTDIVDFYNIKVDEMLSKIFISNRQIKSLKLECFESLTGKCFLNLNESVIEEISLYLHKNNAIKGEFLIQSWPYFEKFRKLQFKNYEGNDFAKIAECISSCLQLKELFLWSIENCKVDDLMKSIPLSKNLENLFIGYCVVSKELCHHISSNVLDLKILKILYCENFCLSCAEAICELEKSEKLEELYLSCSKNISDKVNELVNNKLPKLKKFQLLVGQF